MNRCIVFLLVVVFGCGKPPQQAPDEAAINNLYNAVIKNRYTVNDSLKQLALQLQQKTSAASPTAQAMSAIVDGIYLARTSDYKGSLQRFENAVAMLESNKGPDSLLARAYNGIGNAYKNMGNYPNAVQHLQKALAYFEKLKIPEGIAGVHSNLAQSYQMKGDSMAALQHLRQGLAVLQNERPSRAYLNLVHTLANAHLYSNKMDSALLLDRQGLAIAESIGATMFRSPFYDNKANVFAQKGMADSARIYYMRCLAIDSGMGNYKLVSDTYLNLGRLEAKQKNTGLAASHLQKSISLGQKAAYKQGQRDAWQALSTLHEKEGNYAAALAARNRFEQLNDSMINEATEKKLAELQMVFETGKKEQQLQLQAAQLSQQRLIIWIVAGVAVGLSLAVYHYYRRRQLRKAAEMQQALMQQKSEATIRILTAEEKERQRIATDLHDGIGQTMTAAWLNLQALAKRLPPGGEETALIEKTTTLVGDSCAEVRQVSHNMMPNALQRKGLISAVRGFTAQLDEKLISVRLQADDDKLRLAPTTELILYRVIQECVNNVVKHAAATELDISIVHDKEGLDVLVEDNGKGFDVAQQSSGLGIQNIRSRIQYLGGTVEWDNTGSGTVVAIHIPYHHE